MLTALASALLYTGPALPTPVQEAAFQADWLQSPVSGSWYGVEYTPRTWTASSGLAQSMGISLADIPSREENDWLVSAWTPFAIQDGNPAVWLGGTDASTEGTWIWTSGATWTFERWGTGEPSAVGSGEDYLELVLGSWNFVVPGDWNDEYSFAIQRALYKSSHPYVGWSWPRTTPTGARPFFASVVDLDDDADEDIVLTAGWLVGNNTVEVLLNDGAGGLTAGPSLTVGAEPRGLAVLDGPTPATKLIAVCCESEGEIQLLQHAGGVLSLVSTVDTGEVFQMIASLDADADGDADLVASTNPGGLYLYTNDGNEDFTRSSLAGWTGASVSSIQAQDVNADGRPDVLVASGNAANFTIFLADGSGGFAAAQVLPVAKPRASVVADLDMDGIVDLGIPSALNDRLEVWAGNGSGGFTFLGSTPLGGHPNFADQADFNGDGHVDAAVAMDNTGELRVLYGDGQGAFTVSEVFSGHADAVVAVALHLNADAAPDLGVVRRGAGGVATWGNNQFSDCDANGIWDAAEIANATAPDCNSNGIHDACDIAWSMSTDLDGNGVPDECLTPTFYANTFEASAALGGTQQLTLNAGSGFALQFFAIFGSSTGTSPGVSDPLTGLTLPLNFDPYFELLYLNAGAGIVAPFFGFLGPNGGATAAVAVPAGTDPSLVGLTLHHAYITVDVFGTGLMTLASNPVPLEITP